MKYANLLNSYIENSELTLDQIADNCKKKGVTIHPTYISKLRKGQRPAPTEDISKALAEACGHDSKQLVFAGYLEKTPSPIAEKFSEYEGLFSVVSQSLIHLCNDEGFLKKLSSKLGYEVTFERLRELFQELPVPDQMDFITSSGFTLQLEETKKGSVDVWLEFIGDSSDHATCSVVKENRIKYPPESGTLVIPNEAISLSEQRIVELPVYGEVRAGIGGYAVQDYLGSQEWMVKNGNCKDCYMLKIKGDSMTPRFLPGDYAVVRPQNDVDSGDIAIVLVDSDEGIIKRIKKYSEGIILKSDNSLFEDREFYGQDRSRVKIIGKVIDIKAGRL